MHTYEENFSDWLLDLDHVLSGRYVISDNPADFKVFDQKFPWSPEAQYKEGVSESSIEVVTKIPITKVIMISGDNKRKLQLVRKGFPELKNWKPSAKSDFTFSRMLGDKTYLIVINSVKEKSQKQIETLKLGSSTRG